MGSDYRVLQQAAFALLQSGSVSASERRAWRHGWSSRNTPRRGRRSSASAASFSR